MNAFATDLNRLSLMGAIWDDAAEALSRKDYAEFDRHMAKFRELQSLSQVSQGDPRGPKSGGCNHGD